MFSYEMLVNCENRLPEDFVPPSLAAPDIAFAADPSDEKRFLEVRAARHAKRLLTPPKQRGFFSMASPDTAATNVRKYSIRRPAANLLPLHLYAKLPCLDAANIRPDWPLMYPARPSL